ncbi:MAG: SH3 domain-containing protein [Sphingobacteriia bacterium]|nr:SH3 domain-containing protein [Sphingobacteriia bacterium]
MKHILISVIIFLLSTQITFAKEKLPIPRFVTIKSNEANVRTGPNVRYPVKWVFISKNEPVEILAEFEQWRKIRDISGEEGWVHESMLSGKRFVVVKASDNQILFKNSTNNTYPVVIVEPAVRAKLLECTGESCRIQAKDYKGWIKKDKIWGVYKNEIYK